MTDKPAGVGRRFPAPWCVIEIPGGYKVEDANGVALSYVYARDDLAEKTAGDKVLTTHEARVIAHGIARLPELMRERDGTQE